MPSSPLPARRSRLRDHLRARWADAREAGGAGVPARLTPVPEIYGPRHPTIRRLRALARDRRARDETAECLLEGPRVISAALDRRAPVGAAYLGPGARRAFAPLVARLEAAGVAVADLREGALERVATTRTPQPVLAVATARGVDLADLPVDGLVVVLDGVADPGNLGTILRSAEAAGAAGVVVAGQAVDVRNPKVVRASAGAVFGLPFSEQPDAVATLEALAARGVRCLAAVAAGGPPPDAVDLTGEVAVVLGNEARGVGATVRRRCAGTVTIPMSGAAESLNVAMAATVLCFEAARQRAWKPREVGP